MKINRASIALAGVALMTCTSAWSWYMKGDVIQFNAAERNFCEAGAMDAAAIMYSRQMGTSLSYAYEAYSDIHEKMREKFRKMAEDYPIESTKEKKMAVADKFTNDMHRGCFLYLKVSQPESFAE